MITVFMKSYHTLLSLSIMLNDRKLHLRNVDYLDFHVGAGGVLMKTLG